jgi:hypothetical protein
MQKGGFSPLTDPLEPLSNALPYHYSPLCTSPSGCALRLSGKGLKKRRCQSDACSPPRKVEDSLTFPLFIINCPISQSHATFLLNCAPSWTFLCFTFPQNIPKRCPGCPLLFLLVFSNPKVPLPFLSQVFSNFPRRRRLFLSSPQVFSSKINITQKKIRGSRSPYVHITWAVLQGILRHDYRLLLPPPFEFPISTTRFFKNSRHSFSLTYLLRAFLAVLAASTRQPPSNPLLLLSN